MYSWTHDITKCRDANMFHQPGVGLAEAANIDKAGCVCGWHPWEVNPEQASVVRCYPGLDNSDGQSIMNHNSASFIQH